MQRTVEQSTQARTAALLSGIFLAFGVFWGGYGALVPEIKAAVGTDDAGLGRAMLFIALGAIAGMTWAGSQFDKRGARGLLLAGIAFAVSILPIALVKNMAWLLVAFALLGLASGVLDVFINGAVSVYENVHGRALMGPAHAFFSLGVLMSGPAVGFARDQGFNRFVILLPLSVVVAVSSATMPGVALPPPRGSKRRVRLTSTLALFGGLCALAFLIEDGLLAWSALHLEETLGGSAVVGGLGPGMLAASMVAGRFATQVVVGRFSARQIIGAAGLVGAVGATLFALAPDPAIGLATVAVTGLAISVCAPVIFGAAGRVGGPGAQGGAIARTTTVAYFGFVVGPALVGGVAGAAGLRAGLLVLSAAALLMSAGSRLMAP